MYSSATRARSPRRRAPRLSSGPSSATRLASLRTRYIFFFATGLGNSDDSGRCRTALVDRPQKPWIVVCKFPKHRKPASDALIYNMIHTRKRNKSSKKENIGWYVFIVDPMICGKIEQLFKHAQRRNMWVLRINVKLISFRLTDWRNMQKGAWRTANKITCICRTFLQNASRNAVWEWFQHSGLQLLAVAENCYLIVVLSGTVANLPRNNQALAWGGGKKSQNGPVFLASSHSAVLPC